MTSPAPAISNYRPEIDGLRAVAVLAVLLFHLDLAFFSGGFVGVDVFFVISGYLITRNIRAEIAKNSFSLSRFYIKRIRRLFPALLTTIAISSVAAIFIFSPEHLARTPLETVSALFSFSNFYFWSESGYFDLDANLKPLLHTWSLSVEEQFYLLWPSLLIALGLFKRHVLQVGALVIAGAISLFMAERFIEQGSASLAFYMLPFRACEFIIGAIISFTPDPTRQVGNKSRSLISLAGLALILYPVSKFTEATTFPGLSAILPCAGTALIIWARSNSVTIPLLQNTAFQWIGKTSYSVYLVHWPLVVFWEYVSPNGLSPQGQLIIFSASLFLGYLSWKWVEQPFRHNGISPERLPVIRLRTYTAFLASVTVTSIAAVAITDGNVTKRQTTLSAEEVAKGKSDRFNLTRQACKLLQLDDSERCNTSAHRQVLIIGNSHEPDGYNIWRQAYSSPDTNIVSFGTTNKCGRFIKSPELDIPDRRKCKPRLKALLSEEFLNSLDVVVYSSNRPFSSDKESIFEILTKMKRANPSIEFIFLGGYFNLKKDCSFYIDKYGNPEACLTPDFIHYDDSAEVAAIDEWVGSSQAKLLNPRYVNKFELLCEGGSAICRASEQGIPFTYDKHHLSLEFAKMLGSKLSEKYARIEDLALLSETAGK